jgi:hypothetical protein
MPSTGKNIHPPIFVEVTGLDDLARLSCALERVSLPIFRFKINGDTILAAQLDIFKGTPIIYYVKNAQAGRFLGYRKVGGKEVAEMSASARDPTNTYAPIISIENAPRIFEEGFVGKPNGHEQCLSMQVSELESLCKIALYRIVFEETPLPIFTFPAKKEQWILGTFTRMDDADETTIFFYMILNGQPDNRFVRYSSVNPDKTDLIDRIDEHGYVYGKICKLKETHPLVDL